MTTHFTDLARRAAADGQVDSHELLDLRREAWGDGIIAQDEAEALFALNDALEERDDEWADFFVEAIGEFVLNTTQPRLQCDDDEARWLIEQVDHDGRVESLVELETIVRIIERAQNVPEILKTYIIQQVESEVMTGIGPTRCGGKLTATHISAAECRILRRVIFAAGGSAPAAVSRHEAEMLFRLKDATVHEDNAPEWDELFLDGVTNYLKSFALQNAQLDHDRARELQSFIADNEANVGRFFGKMAREVPQVRNHFGKVFGKKANTPGIAEQAEAGAKITDSESEWLDRMIEADGEVDELERRLLTRIMDDAA